MKDKDQRLDEKKEDLDGAQEGPVQEAQRLEDRLPEPFKKTKIRALRDTLRGMQTSESKARKKLLKGAGARKKRLGCHPACGIVGQCSAVSAIPT